MIIVYGNKSYLLLMSLKSCKVINQFSSRGKNMEKERKGRIWAGKLLILLLLSTLLVIANGLKKFRIVYVCMKYVCYREYQKYKKKRYEVVYVTLEYMIVPFYDTFFHNCKNFKTLFHRNFKAIDCTSCKSDLWGQRGINTAVWVNSQNVRYYYRKLLYKACVRRTSWKSPGK